PELPAAPEAPRRTAPEPAGRTLGRLRRGDRDAGLGRSRALTGPPRAGRRRRCRLALPRRHRTRRPAATLEVVDTDMIAHLFVFDGFADWEPAFAVAGIQDPRFQSEPGRWQVKTVAMNPSTPVRSMGGLSVLPDLA